MKAYKSTLTGTVIADESSIVTLVTTINDALKTLYFKDCVEIKDWWLHEEPRPDLGGEVEISCYSKEVIEDEAKKITLDYKNQTFVFVDTQEAIAWYQEVC